ncbi:thiamine diphosphokinase [Balneolales bacterium ANBcel1]|nr:thiamine diphosphokinase [Balneolales bacterium ANBcel1]
MRILILAHGDPPEKPLMEKLTARCDFFIAADGAGNTALELGYPPDLVIGDLDSFRPADGFTGRIIRDPDQETNDLEKALLHAITMNASRVDVLGATGGRLDHTLKNLSVMQQLHDRFGLLAFFDASFYVRILPRDFSLSLPAGHPVSLFPLSGIVEGIVTEGLRYPLNNESLENGRRDGSSNETTGDTLRIRHRSGALLFMAGHTDLLF